MAYRNRTLPPSTKQEGAAHRAKEAGRRSPKAHQGLLIISLNTSLTDIVNWQTMLTLAISFPLFLLEHARELCVSVLIEKEKPSHYRVTWRKKRNIKDDPWPCIETLKDCETIECPDPWRPPWSTSPGGPTRLEEDYRLRKSFWCFGNHHAQRIISEFSPSRKS